MTRRLFKELEKFNDDPPPGIGVCLRDDNINLWDCFIMGPEGTPWEGGKFQLTMSFNWQYPSSPPQVKFKSRVFHPNVYPDGRICVDFLEDGWIPSIWSEKTLVAKQSMLDSPTLESPANPEAAKSYRMHRDQYDKEVRALSAAAATHIIEKGMPSSQP